ncbi:hypothetical protein [Neptuniibacter sp. QD37_11]|uniref:hypothetical protein n=1 Tax=Neptuniibacter sp. QD37_11 TaxID=3398209 RepID=UPI0039F49E1C
MQNYIYQTDCANFRRTDKEGHELREAQWHEMMANRVSIPEGNFTTVCDVDTLLDEGETLDEYLMGDPDAGFYRSAIDGYAVFFIQHSGFEMIFWHEDGLESGFKVNSPSFDNDDGLEL